MLHVIRLLELDHIFQRPGRNDRCHCGSGRKYKVCHEAVDQAAWRIVSLKTRQAEVVCASLPRSNRPEFNPDL